MMAKKTENTPRPKRLPKIPLPEYNKPHTAFQKEVQVGNKVKLSIRYLDRKRGVYDMEEVEGVVMEVGTNHVWIYGVDFPTPWYTIHDWEIYNAEN